MAEPHRKSGSFQIQVSYSFDRVLELKLAQAYNILVPCRERPVGVKEFDNEDGSNLRQSFVRAATRRSTRTRAQWRDRGSGSFWGYSMTWPREPKLRIAEPSRKRFAEK